MLFKTVRDRFAFLFFSLACLPGDLASGDDPAVEEQRFKKMRLLAESFEVFVDAKRSRRAELVEAPIFRWSNPERGSKGGTLFLWTDRGRPHAMIGTWTYQDRKISHELQSLAQGPFVTVRGERVVWQPGSPGLQFQKIERTSPPDESPAIRNKQLRELAKRFSAHLHRSRDGKPETLRMLPRAIYRYKPLPDGVIDGALYSYSQGTDPEVLLLLEAREDDAHRRQWFYAFAPATSGRVEGRDAGETVWNGKEFQRRGVNGTFQLFLFRGE